jgi:hypothetical protein
MARPDRPVRLQVLLKRYSPECVEYEFSEVREPFIADSSPVASVSAQCNTAAGSKVLSPPYARRREVVRTNPLRCWPGTLKNFGDKEGRR